MAGVRADGAETSRNPLMRYHDFHLRGYEVGNCGASITLDLVSDYPDREKEESAIEFSDVLAYRFIHTGGAIIVDILEIPIGVFLAKHEVELARWAHQHGLGHWQDNTKVFQDKLEATGYRAWEIDSAIGFEGLVIAKGVRQLPNE